MSWQDNVFNALLDVDGLNGEGGPCRLVVASTNFGIFLVFCLVLGILAFLAVLFLGLAPFIAAVDAFYVIAGRQDTLKAPWIFIVVPIYYILFKLARKFSRD